MGSADRSAADLKADLDAMRTARVADNKTCARLTERVKELEEMIGAVVREIGAVHPSHLVQHSSLGRIARVVGYVDDEPRLAEGTRDEVPPARCARCGVAIGVRFDFCQACAVEVGMP